MVSKSALNDDGTIKESLTASELQETSDDSALMKKIPIVSQLSLMQESLVMANEMTLIDKLSFYAQSTQTLNLFQKLEVDSILNGINSSKYWNEYVQVISLYLSSLTPIERFDLDSHLLNGYVSQMGSSSWFSTRETYLQRQNSLKISCPSSIAKELPGYQLQEAVADAVDAQKQAIANGGTAKFKSCRQPSQVIKFKAGNYKKNHWYPTKVKGLTYRSPEGFPPECSYGTQLVFERGKWYGIFPEYKQPLPTSQSKVIALDPGVRKFLTGYDGEKIVEFGNGDIGKIQRLCSHLDQLMSPIDLSVAKRQRRAMRLAGYRIREKIQSHIKDLHNKVARFLVKEYKVIFLPTFSTSEMVVKSGRKLNKKNSS